MRSYVSKGGGYTLSLLHDPAYQSKLYFRNKVNRDRKNLAVHLFDYLMMSHFRHDSEQRQARFQSARQHDPETLEFL